MRFQAITQIILILLSLVIIFTVVRPMFAAIQVNQEEVQEFREALTMAGQFNAQLSELQNRARSFNSNDLNALEMYVPQEIDTLAVSRDILIISEQNQLLVQSIEAMESETGDENIAEDVEVTDIDGVVGDDDILEQEADRTLSKKRFSVEAIGTYEQMKQTLMDFERNAYPLRLVGFTLSAEEEGVELYNFSIELETYALDF